LCLTPAFRIGTVRILPKGVPVDPWGHSYVYRRTPGKIPEIISFGMDGAPGGSGLNADISSLKDAN